MPLLSNYLLIISSIYKRKINKIASSISDDYLIDRNFIDFLQLHGANENDIENWLNANKTVLYELIEIKWDFPSIRNKGLRGWKGRESYYLFYTDDRPKGIDETPIATLVGSGNIKPLLVYKYDPLDAYSKTIGHFGFLVPFIARTIGTGDALKLKETTEKFIHDNRDILNRIRSQFQTEPKELGQGSDGIAYSIGKDRVLKLFRSEVGYRASVLAIERLWKQPETAGTEAMIYDTGSFKPIRNTYNTYYYIMERMEPAYKIAGIGSLVIRLQELANIAIEDNKEWSKFDIDPSIGPKIAPEIKQASEMIDRSMKSGEIAMKLIRSIEEQAKSNNLKSNWLAKLTEEIIWKLITKRTDLHEGNLGITPNGEFRYFDPAY
jgi:hypothetical protein